MRHFETKIEQIRRKYLFCNKTASPTAAPCSDAAKFDVFSVSRDLETIKHMFTEKQFFETKRDGKAAKQSKMLNSSACST